MGEIMLGASQYKAIQDEIASLRSQLAEAQARVKELEGMMADIQGNYDPEGSEYNASDLEQARGLCTLGRFGAFGVEIIAHAMAAARQTAERASQSRVERLEGALRALVDSPNAKQNEMWDRDRAALNAESEAKDG